MVPKQNNNRNKWKPGESGNATGNSKTNNGGCSSNANLYEEASKIMKTLTQKGTSGGLRSIIYNHKTNKSDPRQLYALVSSTLKFRELLTAVIKASGMLKTEKRAFGGSDVNLALLMAHDLLLSRSGRITSKKSLAKDAILKHKTRLKAELVKYKVKHKIHDINTLITEKDETPVRWIRINTILVKDTTEIESWLFSNFTLVEDWHVLDSKSIYKDTHVQHLYGIHPSVSVAQLEHYKTGKLIIQDRASCFPATIMSQTFGVDKFIKTIDVPKGALEDSNEAVRLIDACSAPGNKTTHLAALSGSSSRKPKHTMYRIHAFERDERRSKILKKMVGVAGANNCVDVVVGDFTQVAMPNEYPEVVGLIVDPSCSGSGIFGRGFIEQEEDENDDTDSNEVKNQSSDSVSAGEQERLLKLAGFQYKIVKHALSFPKAQVVVYSTCSIHAQENEHVVERLLDDPTVAAQGWRVANRTTVLPEWPRRGFPTEFNKVNQGGKVRSTETVAQIAEGCVRALPKEDGGIGFFAVCFVRSEEDAQRWLDSPAFAAVTDDCGRNTVGKKRVAEKNNDLEADDDEEWGGFDD